MSGTKKILKFAAWVTNPSSCKSKITYKLTIPTEISDIAKSNTAGNELTLSGTTTKAKAVGDHTITLTAYGPSGLALTSGSVTFKLTVEKAVVKTTTTTTTTTVKKPPLFAKPESKATITTISNVISVGQSAVAAVG